MGSIVPAQHVARILNQRMLEAAAGAEERDAVLAGITGGNKRRIHIFIRTCRNQPEGIVANKIFRTAELGGRNPVIIRCNIEYGCGIIDGQRDRLVR
jgi:hypothetical protein